MKKQTFDKLNIQIGNTNFNTSLSLEETKVLVCALRTLKYKLQDTPCEVKQINLFDFKNKFKTKKGKITKIVGDLSSNIGFFASVMEDAND
jgi:hypothetical protein